jgi:hypothetical protein
MDTVDTLSARALQQSRANLIWTGEESLDREGRTPGVEGSLGVSIEPSQFVVGDLQLTGDADQIQVRSRGRQGSKLILYSPSLPSNMEFDLLPLGRAVVAPGWVLRAIFWRRHLHSGVAMLIMGSKSSGVEMSILPSNKPIFAGSTKVPVLSTPSSPTTVVIHGVVVFLLLHFNYRDDLHLFSFRLWLHSL